MRTHKPANENTGENYAPIYYDTINRMEIVFGELNPRIWRSIGEQTCSGCYSVTPSETKVNEA